MKIYRIAIYKKNNLKSKMMTFLHNHFPDEGWQDEAEVAIYWFASDYHDGQSSELYSILSTSPYKPGPISTLESEGETVKEMYEALEEEFAPKQSVDAVIEKNLLIAKLKTLKNEARAICENRGHDMMPWSNYFDDSKAMATTYCNNCNRYAQVNTNPLSNEIDIGGDATVVNCGDAIIKNHIEQATPEELYRDLGLKQ